MMFLRKKVYKMINFNKMWKTINMYKKQKRNIKEVEFYDINLKEYLIIDVRTKREFSENHINGAINIPLQEIKTNIVKYSIDKKKKILIYCKSGGRSTRAVELLENMGYDNVYNLKGGIENI